MSARDNISKLQFGHENMGRLHIITAKADNEEVGHLSWANEKGSRTFDLNPHEVYNVQVQKPYRRQGVATNMWHMAQEIDPEVAHSPERSPAGNKWARSVGGPDPWRD